jgi:hypothetical protein
MIQTIETIENVKVFFRHLLSEGLNFHPDTPFEDYINSETRLDTYTEEEANLRNGLLDECFNVCERLDVDIYEIANEIFQTF